MKPIMSFWSEPYIRGFYNRWVNENAWNLSWILSVECITKLYGKPHLYTDNAGKHFLVEQLGLQFESVDLSLNDIRERNPRLFSLGRNYAISVQREPFLHFDYDFYLFEKIPDEKLDTGILFERQGYYSYSLDTRLRKPLCDPKLLEEARFLPDWWKSYEEKNEYNHAKLGLMGGSNIEYFQNFTQSVFDIVNANSDNYWNGLSKPLSVYHPQYAIDEYSAICIAKKMGVTPKYLKSMDGDSPSKFAHVGNEKIFSSEIYGRIACRLIKDFPHTIDKVKEYGCISSTQIPKVSVIIMPNEVGTTYDSMLRIVIPRNVSPDEIFVSAYKLSNQDKELISKIDGVRIVPASDSYMESLRNVFKRTSGNLIIIIDGHIKVPKLYIEKCIAATMQYPNCVFCAASVDFSDNKNGICYGGLEDDYGIRPNLIERKGSKLSFDKVSSLYGGFYALPSAALHKVFDGNFSDSFLDISKHLDRNGFEIRCICGIEASNNFKTSSVAEASKC